jgi:hypothetical protein
MRCRTAVFLVCVFVFSFSSMAQQPVQVDGRVRALLEQANAALAGTTIINDVALAGTARRTAGAEDEMGATTLKALVTGEARIDSTFPSGQYSEVRTNSKSGPVGHTIDPAGNVHEIPFHNLLTDSTWFFPALMLRKMSSSQPLVWQYIGTETRDDRLVEHVVATEQFTGSSLPDHALRLLEHSSRVEIYFDSSTFLPYAVTFNAHPDNDVRRDIPTEIRFSDYRVVNGVKVPFKILKFLNNGVVLDVQLETVVLNTGLSATAFTTD